MAELEFRPIRVFRLIKNDLVMHRRSILIALAAVFTLLIVNDLIAVSYNKPYDFHHFLFFPLTLFLGGGYVALISFKDIHLNNNSIHNVMIPASLLEKWLSRWCLSTFGVIIGAIAFYTLFALFAGCLNQIVFSRGIASFHPVGSTVRTYSIMYLIWHSVIFTAGAFFRKLILPKLLLICAAFAMIAQLVYFLTIGVIYKDVPILSSYMIMMLVRSVGMTKWFWWTQWTIMPLLLWVISFYRLKEGEY